MSTRALAVGHVTLDAYPGGPRVGGSVHYAAQVWRALGAEVGVHTAAGPDFATLDPGGLVVQPSPETTRFSNTYDAEGHRRQVLVARAVPLVPVAAAADLAFLCPVLQDFAPEPWIATLAAVPLLGAGLQGWLKHAEPGGEVAFGPRCDPRRFAGLAVAFLSDEDLAGREDWLAGLRAVVPRVYVTRGRAGSTLFEGARAWWVGTHPAHAVDPTGAGDTYAAAALWALAQGADGVEAGRWGAAAASVVVEHVAAAPVEALRATTARVAGVAWSAGGPEREAGPRSS